MRFHGHVDEEAIPGTYRGFDVLAVPSVPMPGWLEQFGRVVVEAQASGIPVVASASGALPDVVGEAGLLVPPGTRAPSAPRSARLLDEPGLWSRLAEMGIGRRRHVLMGQRGGDPDGPVPGSGAAHRPRLSYRTGTRGVTGGWGTWSPRPDTSR